MMRQAGRFLPEYRAVRATVDFLTLCKTPELAAQVTLQPIDILGVDAAVIFSDILVLLEAMGLPIEFGRNHGPKIQKTIRTEADLKVLRFPDIERDLKYVGDAIRLASKVLTPRNIPVLGFAGAPFTLACYAVEGETSRDFNQTKCLMNSAPKTFTKLLDKLADGIASHLIGQIEAGARAVQLFDTWAGVLSKTDYRNLVLPSLQRAIAPIKSMKIPVILYVNGSTPHLETMANSGADVLSVDWRLPLSEVRAQVGPKIGLQGNLDPALLFANRDTVQSATKSILDQHPGSGFIANLGHGILPNTPVDNVRAFVDTIKGSN
jgi:uroporphyrinogen decarboxylase